VKVRNRYGIVWSPNATSMSIHTGQKAPEFSLPDQAGETHTLSQYSGKWVLVYFYPKDMTPGCTIEACEIRDNFSAFKKANVVVLGISADSQKLHEKFARTFSLPFPLLSDPKKEAISAYGAVAKKSMFGKTFLGIVRSSVLIAPDGTVAKMYPKVSPKGHAQQVLQDISALTKS